MSFSHSDNDLARHLGLLGEQFDSNLSREFSGLPSVDFASILNSDMLSPSKVKVEDIPVGQSAKQDALDGLSDADCSSLDAESDSDDDTATAPQQPGTPRHPRADMPEAHGIALPATSMALPVCSADMPLNGVSPTLRATHSAMPHTSQGFVALSDINTASGQAHSHSVSSSPSSALGGTSSNLFERATTSSDLVEQKNKRKADQMDLDTILDPAEKKKQRRLAKNRATAALSRERKKAQLQVLQQRVRVLEQENTSLSQALSIRDAEIRRLKDRAAGQPKGVECDNDTAGTATTEVAKNPGPRIVYPAVSALPRIYRSVANPPSSSFPHQPRAPLGHPPVGATTHYPQRSVFSAPILEHASRSEQPSVARSEQLRAHSNVRSQSVHPTQSVQQSQSVHPSQSGHPSQSAHPSQSGQQHSAAAAVVESCQQEATSHHATPRSQPAASGFQPEQQTGSMQPSSQTPFNVVTSGESGQLASKRSANTTTDKQRMAPPAADGFTTQISPFVAQSEHALHIQQAPHTQPAPVSDSSPQQKYPTHPLSRGSGSVTYGSAYPPPSFVHTAQQDQSHIYTPNIQSHMSSQGSAGWQPMPQYSYQNQQQQQQQQHVPAWSGYDEVRTSPRHPGAWHWSDGVGQNQLEGLHQSTSTTWDSQNGQSSQFSAPSEWQEQQPWHQGQQQQSEASGLWAGPVRPPWPPQAIAVTPQGSAFGHTVGPLTEPHRLPGELEPPACRWMASANSTLAEMFPGN